MSVGDGMRAEGRGRDGTKRPARGREIGGKRRRQTGRTALTFVFKEKAFFCSSSHFGALACAKKANRGFRKRSHTGRKLCLPKGF